VIPNPCQHLLIFLLPYAWVRTKKGFGSERRKRTANGRQDGGHENVIGDKGIHWLGVRGEADVYMLECCGRGIHLRCCAGRGGCVYDGVLRKGRP